MRKKFEPKYRVFSAFLSIVFTFVFGCPAHAQGILDLPAPGVMVPASPNFTPTLLKGMTVDPSNPLDFDFLVDSGDVNLQGDELKEEITKLIRYFMASLTVPEDEMWVNLSPYQKDRIIPSDFGKTEMGRDLLGQDYILKQVTSSLMYPENDLGDGFWNKVYEKAAARYGTSEIPMNTFNKVWIVPQKAVLYIKGKSIFVIENHLKVMLQEDYLALEVNKGSEKYGLEGISQKDIETMSSAQSEIVREILIPEIEREVNQGKNFANLRQIFNSLILATWYKKNIKNSLLNGTYINKRKISGVNIEDKSIIQKIYNKYVDAFKQGVFNYVKEDYDPASQKIIPRKYFSGGVDPAMVVDSISTNGTESLFRTSLGGPVHKVSISFDPMDTSFPVKSATGQGGNLSVDFNPIMEVLIFLQSQKTDQAFTAFHRMIKLLSAQIHKNSQILSVQGPVRNRELIMDTLLRLEEFQMEGIDALIQAAGKGEAYEDISNRLFRLIHQKELAPAYLQEIFLENLKKHLDVLQGDLDQKNKTKFHRTIKLIAAVINNDRGIILKPGIITDQKLILDTLNRLDEFMLDGSVYASIQMLETSQSYAAIIEELLKISRTENFDTRLAIENVPLENLDQDNNVEDDEARLEILSEKDKDAKDQDKGGEGSTIRTTKKSEFDLKASQRLKTKTDIAPRQRFSQLIVRAGETKSVLFVCTGNLNRSQNMQMELENALQGNENIKVSSGGTMFWDGLEVNGKINQFVSNKLDRKLYPRSPFSKLIRAIARDDFSIIEKGSLYADKHKMEKYDFLAFFRNFNFDIWQNRIKKIEDSERRDRYQNLLEELKTLMPGLDQALNEYALLAHKLGQNKVLHAQAKKNGIQDKILNNLESKPISRRMLQEADVIVVAAEEHRSSIERNFPHESKKKIFLFTEIAPQSFSGRKDVPDPQGLTGQAFIDKTQQMFAGIQKGINQDFIPLLNDQAILSEKIPGGINLNASIWDMEVQGNEFAFDILLDPSSIQILPNDGYMPVVRSIILLKNFTEFIQ